MATTGKFNGDLMVLDLDGNAIAHSTDATLSITKNTPDSTTKDSGGFAENLTDGHISWETSANGVVTFDAANNAPDDIITKMLAGTDFAVKFTTGVTGDFEYSGNATCSKFDQNAPMDGVVTYSASFKGNGTLAKATVV